MSSFGEWGSDGGLPAFREAVHPDDAVCEWDPIVAPVTNRHWCALGNRRVQVVFDNYGTAAIRDTANGFAWLTPRAGTGATVIDGWATDYPRWPSSWAEQAPVRTWGPTWFTIEGEHDGIGVTRTVALPEGESPLVLVRVEVTSATTRTVTLAEEWELVNDALLASFRDEDRRETTPEVELEAGVPYVSWYTVGLLDEEPPPADPEATWNASLAALKGRLPSGEL